MNSELLEFTRRAIERGAERQEIARLLQQAGWAEDDVTATLAAFAPTAFPIAVPRPAPNLMARDAFLYAVMFVALNASASNLGLLAFEFIDRAYPDPVAGVFYLGYFIDTIRLGISSLIVTFPLFLFTFHSVTVANARNPARRGSRPRKWLTYLTLFIAAASLVGDLTCLVYKVLGGEFTSRFGLKVATVVFIAGGIFAYFLTDMRRDEFAQGRAKRRGMTATSPLLFAGASGIAVVAAIVAGFGVIGSPADMRARRLDEAKVSTLQSIRADVENYRRTHDSLPDTIEQLQQADPTRMPIPAQPVSGLPYEYRIEDAASFELCAQFERDNSSAAAAFPGVAAFWNHGRGRHCFNFVVDVPDRR